MDKIDSFIRKLDSRALIRDCGRAEKLSHEHPDRKNILHDLNEAIKAMKYQKQPVLRDFQHLPP